MGRDIAMEARLCSRGATVFGDRGEVSSRASSRSIPGRGRGGRRARDATDAQSDGGMARRFFQRPLSVPGFAPCTNGDVVVLEAWHKRIPHYRFASGTTLVYSGTPRCPHDFPVEWG
jgi:hypothetical protein